MQILKILRILSLIIAVLLTPFIIIFIPFCLPFYSLTYALGRHTVKVSEISSKTMFKTILFTLLTISVTSISIWANIELSQVFGNDTNLNDEIIGTILFGFIGIGALTAYITSPK